jgi:hypothetical protein
MYSPGVQDAMTRPSTDNHAAMRSGVEIFSHGGSTSVPPRSSAQAQDLAGSGDPPRFSTARAPWSAVARAEAAVAAIPLATTDPSVLTSQLQPVPSGSSLTSYETELTIWHGELREPSAAHIPG